MVTEEKRRRSPRINYVKRVEYWKGKQYQKGVEQAKVEAHKRKPFEESAREHIGKFLDSLKGTQGVDVAIYGALAYLSYQTFGIRVYHSADMFKTSQDKENAVLVAWGAIESWKLNPSNKGKPIPKDLQDTYDSARNGTVGSHSTAWSEVINAPEAALIGPIGLKLALARGGTPPVSQIAGLAILGTLGLLESGLPEEIAAILASHAEAIKSHSYVVKWLESL